MENYRLIYTNQAFNIIDSIKKIYIEGHTAPTCKCMSAWCPVFSSFMSSVPSIGSRHTMILTRIKWLLKKRDEIHE